MHVVTSFQGSTCMRQATESWVRAWERGYACGGILEIGCVHLSVKQVQSIREGGERWREEDEGRGEGWGEGRRGAGS